jgi:MoxR-like ATPase
MEDDWRYNAGKICSVRLEVPVRLLAAALLAVLLSVSAAVAQHPIPPGVRQGEQIDAQMQQNIPPPAGPQRKIDMAKLAQDASDLARLAQTIPSDVASVQEGLLPRETLEKLKQIEKLSKHLRSQLNP